MQTAAAHGSHAVVSAAPAVHGECAHVPPELPVVVLVAVAVELLPDILPPQGLVTGTHTLTACPSVVLTPVHVVPEGHAPPLEQSTAQYVSPANCAQSEPEPQAGVDKQGVHWPAPPLELVVACAPDAVPVAAPVPDAAPVLDPVAPGPEEDSPPAPPLMLLPLEPQDAAAAAERETHKNERRRSREKQPRMTLHAPVTIWRLQGKERAIMGHD